jgi:hypothetical protein
LEKFHSSFVLNVLFFLGFTMAARGDSIFFSLFGEVTIDMARTQEKEKPF